MLLKFTEEAWKDYCYWQSQDKKTLKRINSLIKEIQRDLFMSQVSLFSLLKTITKFLKESLFYS